MSDTLKIILIVSVFAFFMYRKKFSTLFSGWKLKHTSKNDSGKNSGKDTGNGTQKEALTASSSVSCTSTDGISEQSISVPCRYEVYAFDYAEYAETAHFSDRLNAKLDMIEISMQNKRHYTKFIPLGTCLVILVKYLE